MRKYDQNKPLIFIHIPKTAGTTAGVIFQKWFKKGYIQHYFNEQTGEMPIKYDLFGMCNFENPVVLYGHFNRLRDFGVEDYYPEVKQFITILRDPFEMAISSYFYMKKNSLNWKDQTRIPKNTLREYLLTTKLKMLNHFPREITAHNYKEIIAEYFIHIGITEYLDESMKSIASKLNCFYDSSMLDHCNQTERNQEACHGLRDVYDIFYENNQLELDVYNYVLKNQVLDSAPYY